MNKRNVQKNGKNNKKNTDADVKRYVGAVLDEVKKGFKMGQEQSLSINQRLDRIDATLDSHTEQIGALLIDSTEIKSKLTRIQSDISFDLDKKVDKKHFVNLELRMRKIEKK